MLYYVELYLCSISNCQQKAQNYNEKEHFFVAHLPVLFFTYFSNHLSVVCGVKFLKRVF